MIKGTDFWRVVEFIDWRNNQDSTVNSSKLRAYFDKEDLDELRKMSRFLQSVLSIRCRNVVVELGDDSYWDLTAHIVGLGREVFEDVYENPSRILEYVNQRIENFDYCFNYWIAYKDYMEDYCNPVPCTNEND